MPVDQLLDLKFRGIQVIDAASLYETVFGRVSASDMRPSELVFTGEFGPRSSVIFRSIYSWLLGALGILLAWPLMLLVALIVRLSSPGPVLYRQTRVGRNGELFTLLQIPLDVSGRRSTTPGAVWASKDDPRITP